MSDITTRPFVDACLAGEALVDDVDDWVDTWADNDGAPWGSEVSLAAFLGMSQREYSLWVEESSTLRIIVAAHRQNQDVDQLLSVRGHFSLAARSNDDSAAVHDLIRRLVERGDLPEDAASELPH